MRYGGNPRACGERCEPSPAKKFAKSVANVPKSWIMPAYSLAMRYGGPLPVKSVWRVRQVNNGFGGAKAMLCAKNLKTVKAVLIMILGVGGFTSAQAAFDPDVRAEVQARVTMSWSTPSRPSSTGTNPADRMRRLTELYATATAFIGRKRDALVSVGCTSKARPTTRGTILSPRTAWYARSSLAFLRWAIFGEYWVPTVLHSRCQMHSTSTTASRVIYEFDREYADDTVFSLDLNGASSAPLKTDKNTTR